MQPTPVLPCLLREHDDRLALYAEGGDQAALQACPEYLNWNTAVLYKLMSLYLAMIVVQYVSVKQQCQLHPRFLAAA